jgi:hypothetical protein
MRVALLIAAILVLSSCSGKSEVGANQNSSPATSQSGAAKTEKAVEITKTDANAPPVEFTFLGITPDKSNVSYKIKVNTDKPIDEVHLALKEMDGKGKVVEETTIVWQNIVGSTRRPIENGKTYEDQTALDPTALRAECSLKEVIFKDGAKWSAK